jgi:hypothetical protein
MKYLKDHANLYTVIVPMRKGRGSWGIDYWLINEIEAWADTRDMEYDISPQWDHDGNLSGYRINTLTRRETMLFALRWL